MKVLFVDDEPGVLEQGKLFLEKEVEGLEIETASSAEEGLQKQEKIRKHCGNCHCGYR